MAIDELERAGVPSERVTLLVAGGLARRIDPREVEAFVTPELARRFRGSVEVHDAESRELVPVPVERRHVHVHPALVDTDLVVTVSAAETVLHGGPSVLARRVRPGDDPRRRRLLAARDDGVAGLASRRRARARAAAPRAR